MRDRIILAAMEEMKVHSLKFTMDDLTKRLHVSKSSLYKYISSKDELLDAVIAHVMEDCDRNEQLILASDADAAKKVVAYIQLYLNVFNSVHNGIYDDMKLFYNDKWRYWKTFQDKKIETLVALLNDGIDKQVFREVNLAVVKQALLILSVGLTDAEFLLSNNLTYSNVIEIIFDIMFNGIRCK